MPDSSPSSTDGDPPYAQLQRLVAERPDDARLHFQLGEMLLAGGRADEAVASFRRAAELAPRVAAAQFGLANACYACGQFDAAVTAFRAAQALEADAPTANNLGNALARLGRLDEAAEAFAEALRLDRGFVPALVNAGRMCLARGDFAAAAAQFEVATAKAPDRSSLLTLLGDAYRGLDKFDAAAAQYVRAATLAPNDPTVFARLGDVNLERGQLTEAQFCYAKSLELEPRDAVTHGALLNSLQYDPDFSTERLSEEARYWASRHAPAIPRRPTTDDEPERPIRIGYVGAESLDAVTRSLVETVAARHDRNLFEVVDFSDGVDVLIDLAGHAVGNRILNLAARPAPLQVAWLGYPGTTGLEAIDYLLADRQLVHADEEPLFTERVTMLDGGFAAYVPPTSDVPAGPPPCRERGVVTFGAFHELAKITPSVVGLWSTILQCDPAFRLFIKSRALADRGVQDRLAAQFAECFVERDRLRLEGGATRDEQLAAYGDVDVALDTFPYDGGLPLLDAPWMGVPVVHLRGRRVAGRRGDSLLARAGLDECLVDSREEYVERACRWAADRDRLAELRTRLRAQLLNSPVADVDAFVRGLEAAYREMWRRRRLTQD